MQADQREMYTRALEMREYSDEIFFYMSLKPYVVTPHLNSLVETAQIRGQNICFYAELTKLSLIIIKYSLLSTALEYFSEAKIFKHLNSSQQTS